jgi:hypothetical protein
MAVLGSRPVEYVSAGDLVKQIQIEEKAQWDDFKHSHLNNDFPKFSI